MKSFNAVYRLDLIGQGTPTGRPQALGIPTIGLAAAAKAAITGGFWRNDGTFLKTGGFDYFGGWILAHHFASLLLRGENSACNINPLSQSDCRKASGATPDLA